MNVLLSALQPLSPLLPFRNQIHATAADYVSARLHALVDSDCSVTAGWDFLTTIGYRLLKRAKTYQQTLGRYQPASLSVRKDF